MVAGYVSAKQNRQERTRRGKARLAEGRSSMAGPHGVSEEKGRREGTMKEGRVRVKDSID